MKKVILFFMIIVLFIILIFGVVEEDDNLVDSKSSNIVYSVYSINSDYSDISNLSERDIDLINAVSRGLIYKDNEGNIVPDLAESYEVSEDGIEYKFKLRDDIYWSDGEKITSKDIVDFFKELIKLEEEENIGALINVYGVEQYKQGNISFDSNVAIIIDDDTVTFRLNSVDNNFLNELAKPQYRIRKSLPLWSSIDRYYKDIVYSGYYEITLYEKDNIELTPNTYYGRDRSVISLVKDDNEESAMAQFEVGNRNVVISPPTSSLIDISNKDKLITCTDNTGIYIVMNENEDMNNTSRASIYKNINQAMNDFNCEEPNLLELSEGSYFKSDKNDLNKIQERKVIINNSDENVFNKSISICALDNEVNQKICKFLNKWFINNKDIEIKYDLLSEEKYNSVNVKSYDIILITNKSYDYDKEAFFESFKKYYNEAELQIYNEEKSNNDNYSNLENNLFKNCRIRSLAYINNNICVSSKKINITFDYYGNIDFSKL